RVVDSQEFAMKRKPAQLVFADNSSYSAPLQGLLHIVMPFETLALDGKEEIARLQRSRVDGIGLCNLLPVEIACGRDEFGNPGQREFHRCFPSMFAAPEQS